MKKTTEKQPADSRFPDRPVHPLGNVLHSGFFQLETGPFNQKLHRHANFSLVYLLEGSGSYNDELGVSRRLCPGDLFFTFPDLACSYGPAKNEHWSEVFVLFDGPVFDLWQTQNILIPEKAFFHLHPISYWEKRIREIIDWSTPADYRESLALTCHLQQLLADILLNPHSGIGLEDVDLKPREQTESWVHFAVRILEEEKTVSVSWDEIARRTGVSYETFRKRFSKHMGIAPGRYHMKCLMDHACRLLLSGLPNQHVAESLGFCDEFHFSRRFKQVVGCTPRDFRRKSGRISA